MDVKAIIAHIYQMHSILTKEEEILHALAWLPLDHKLTETSPVTPPATTPRTPPETPQVPPTPAGTTAATAPETSTTPGTTASTTASPLQPPVREPVRPPVRPPATAPPTLPPETEKSRVNQALSEDTGEVTEVFKAAHALTNEPNPPEGQILRVNEDLSERTSQRVGAVTSGRVSAVEGREGATTIREGPGRHLDRVWNR